MNAPLIPLHPHIDRVVVINDHSTATGGTAVLALLSIREMRARGIAVTLICGDDGNNPELRGLDVEVVPANGSDLLRRSKSQAMSRGMYDPATSALVARTRERLDGPGTVYHVHGWAQILSPSIFTALAPVARRTFIHAHDTFLACPNGMFMDYRRGEVCHRVPLGASCLATNCDKRSYAQKLWRVSRHATLNRCLDRQAPWAGIITIHHDVAPKFIRAGYPASLLRLLRNPATPLSRTRIKAERHDGLVYIGRLERDKGVLELVQAAARTDTPLRLIGDGALRADIARDHPRVELCGWQAPESIGALLSGARALVMPSHHPEPFALVIPEAVQSGLPVLVSDTALLASEVETEGFGFGFGVFDPAGFDAAITRVRAMESAAMERMSRHCQRRGESLSTTPRTWVDNLLDLYSGALASMAASAP